MFCIDYDGPHKNRITLTRGDSATLKLKLYDAQNKPVLLTDADRAVLTIKQDIDSPDVVLQLEAKENNLILLLQIRLTLTAADTAMTSR